MTLQSKREIDDLKRENGSLKLKISKLSNQLELTMTEAENLKARYERMLIDKDIAKERDRKTFQRVIKEMDKEIKYLKELKLTEKNLMRKSSETFVRDSSQSALKFDSGLKNQNK